MNWLNSCDSYYAGKYIHGTYIGRRGFSKYKSFPLKLIYGFFDVNQDNQQYRCNNYKSTIQFMSLPGYPQPRDKGGKGGNGSCAPFNSLHVVFATMRMETQNREENSFSLQRVPRVLSVAVLGSKNSTPQHCTFI